MIPSISKSARKLLCKKCVARFPLKKPAEFRKEMRKKRLGEQEQERLTKKGETAALRTEVFTRANGCELDPNCWSPPSEMHHLEGGNGRRLQKQALNNCMAACAWDHREYHRDPEVYRAAVLAWCTRYGYPTPSRFLRAPLSRRPKADARNEPSNALSGAISSARESR